MLENLVTTTQRKIDRARKKLGPSNQEEEGLTTRSKAQAVQQRKKNPAVTVEKASRPDPQYQYVTPIEDPALIKKLVQQSLDSEITISTRELLSVAPDVR